MDRGKPIYNRLPKYFIIEAQDGYGNPVSVRFYNENAIDILNRRVSEAVYELKKYMETDEDNNEDNK